MSTSESKHNSSKAKPQSSTPGNSSQAQHKPGNRKPMPFDDDDTGGEGTMPDTDDPQQKQNIDREF